MRQTNGYFIPSMFFTAEVQEGERLAELWREVMMKAYQTYQVLIESGVPRATAAQIAPRAMLFHTEDAPGIVAPVTGVFETV